MEKPISSNPFSKIKARYLVVVWLFTLIYIPGAQTIVDTFADKWPWYWFDIFFIYYVDAIYIAAIFFLTIYGKLKWHIFFQNPVTVNRLLPGVKLTIFLLLFSTTTSFIIFFPLSYLYPHFVDWWFIQGYEIIYSDGQSYPIIVNILSFISLVLIAPVFEEIAFRGILLHRWAYKYNTAKAMIFSSIIFAIAHPEPISAFVFGIGMCVLYLRSNSLLIPILCHAINNLVVWLIEVGYRVVYGPTYVYTLEEFQNGWYWGIICGILSIAWICVYLRNPVDIKKYRLPSVS